MPIPNHSLTEISAMPLYEYRCTKCERVHEMMQKFSDAPLTECPDCQGQLQKLMSLTSFALKGTGWYTTDYKRKGQSSGESSAPKPEAAKSETAKPEAAKSEAAKPATSS